MHEELLRSTNDDCNSSDSIVSKLRCLLVNVCTKRIAFSCTSINNMNTSRRVIYGFPNAVEHQAICKFVRNREAMASSDNT